MPKKILFVLVENQRGGAEKTVQVLFENLNSFFDFDLTLIKHPREGNLVSFFKNPTKRLFVLFGNQYDIIHSHLFWAGLFVRLVRFIHFGSKKFIWIHTIHYDDYQFLKYPRLMAFLDRFLVFPAVDHLIAVSTSAKAIVKEKNSFAKCEIISNGHDFTPLQTPKTSTRTNEQKNIFCLAHLRKEKGIDCLIQAMPSLIDEGLNIHLNIGGEGFERSHLERLVKDLKLEKSVTFLGHLDNPRPYLQQADVFALPSRSESFGLAILEATCWSLPLIASNVGNISNLLDHGKYGELVDDNLNPLAWAKSIIKVFQNQEEYQKKSQQAYYKFSYLYSKTEMIQKYKDLYNRIPIQGILMVTPKATHSVGGLQKQLCLQGNSLSKMGHHLYLLERTNSQFKIDNTKKNQQQKKYKIFEKWNRFEIWQTPSLPFLGIRLNGLFFILAGLIHLILRHTKFQIIHAHQMYSPTILGVFSKVILRKKLIVKVTAGGDLGEVQELKKLPFFGLRKILFKKIDRVLALNPQIASEIEENLQISSEKIIVVPNSVEIPKEYWNPHISRQEFRLIYTGRISSEKSLETVVEGLKLLKPFPLSICFTIIGEVFKERNNLTQIEMAAQGLPPSIRLEFVGPQINLTPFYFNADLFVLPTTSEGMSNSLLEAMAHGLPVLVSDIPANQFVVTNWINGVFFQTKDALDFSLKLSILIQDSLARGHILKSLGNKARQQMIQYHSCDSIAKKLNDIYSEVLRDTL